MFPNVAEKQSNVGIRRHYNWNDHAITFDKVDDVMCFKHIVFVSGSKEKVGSKCGWKVKFTVYHCKWVDFGHVLGNV